MKILSIDGGGIKGLYSAAFLAGLEERFGRQIADCFDLIAGTSTGGVLALALAARIPAKDIVEFYRTWAPKIFSHRYRLSYLLRGFLLSKYDNTNLELAFKSLFKDLKVKDIYNANCIAFCITSINAVTGEICVFKTPHDPNLVRDLDYFLWEISLATSAAPTYFPLAKIKIPNSTASNLFVDGGLWANNPSMVALIESLTYGNTKIEDIHLLSIGNIRGITTFKSNTILQKGIFFWRQKVIHLTLESQALAVHNQLRLLFKYFNLSSQYMRIEHDKISEAHNCLKSLDCSTRTNLNDLEVYGRERANVEGVKREMMNIFLRD